MVRRQRRWISGLVTLGVVFAQLATVVHACTLGFAPSPAPAVVAQAPGRTPASHCAPSAMRVGAERSACAAHCAYGGQIDVQFTPPAAAIAPQPTLVVRLISSYLEVPLEAIDLQVRGAAPPVSLLFSRFLI